LLDAPQSSSRARRAQGACAGHPTETSRTTPAGRQSSAAASPGKRTALQPQMSFGVESGDNFSVYRFSIYNPDPGQSQVGPKHDNLFPLYYEKCKDSGGSWWTDSTGA